jgi:hypothetical protein
MKKMILIFSHSLSQDQKEDAIKEYEVETFLKLPAELQKLWSNIPPDINSIKELLEPLQEFVSQNTVADDVALIQGDFGAVYFMVNFCKEHAIKTLYATTKREVTESVSSKGETMKKSKFIHVRFREYE